jgi:hypothetical protein
VRLPPLLAVLALVLGLAGCGGGDDGDDGRVVEGTGFELELPDGWSDASERARQLEFAGAKPDVVLVGSAVGGFTPRINVIVEAGISPDARLADDVEAGRRALRTGRVGERRIRGADAEVGEATAAGLGGERAAAFDHVRTVEGRRVRTRQIVALRRGTAYTLTYAAPPDAFDAGLGALNEVLATWRWR